MRFKPKPRFRNDGAGLILLVLFVALVYLLSLAGTPPEPVPAPRTLPPPSIPEPTPIPVPEEPEPVGCPEGCEVPPPGCFIKGNISQRTGEGIYHLPDQRYYGKTVIDPGKGERWFCTEEEAVANGWRKAKV